MPSQTSRSAPPDIAPAALPTTLEASGVSLREAQQQRSALRSPAAHVRFWLVAVAGLAFDLWSKDWAFRELEYHRARVLIPHVLEFQTVLNPGALFGIGAGFTSLFLVASLLALLLVLWMFSQSASGRWLFHIALGAILAGALGNMHDRITVKLVKDPQRPSRLWRMSPPAADGTRVLTEFPARSARPQVRTVRPEELDEYPQPVGYVRDFIKIPTTIAGREMWPWVFNIADMLLVGGVAVLAVGLWTERRPEQAETDDARRPDATADEPLAQAEEVR